MMYASYITKVLRHYVILREYNYCHLLRSTLQVPWRKWGRNDLFEVCSLQLQVQGIQLHKHDEVGK